MTTPEDYEAFAERHLRPAENQTREELVQKAEFTVAPVQLREGRRLVDMVKLNKKCYRKLTVNEKVRVIGLRYGSLSDFS